MPTRGRPTRWVRYRARKAPAAHRVGLEVRFLLAALERLAPLAAEGLDEVDAEHLREALALVRCDLAAVLFHAGVEVSQAVSPAATATPGTP